MIAGFALSALFLAQQHNLQDLNDRGRIYFEQGRLRDAQSSFEQALEAERNQPATRPITHQLALTLNNLGLLYIKLNLLHKAETTLGEAIEIHRSLDDPNGQAQSLLNLGSAYRAESRIEQAADLFRQSLALARRDPDIAAAANNLAVALEVLKRLEGA